MLSEQLADAVATAGAALLAVHARPRRLQAARETSPASGGGPSVAAAGPVNGSTSGGLARPPPTSIPAATETGVLAHRLGGAYDPRGTNAATATPTVPTRTSRRQLKR